MCYNGTSGVWAIAATQFMTTLMAGFIITFRAVFWELQVRKDDNGKKKGKSGRRSVFDRSSRAKSKAASDADADAEKIKREGIDDLILQEADGREAALTAISGEAAATTAAPNDNEKLIDLDDLIDNSNT
jgi:hypothetical protein